MDTIRLIIEALRQKGLEPGITRDPGHMPRRIRGDSSLKDANQNLNYIRYLRQQQQIGETPVSYEEHIR